MAYSFIDLAKETLELVKEPLTQKEIWEKAIEVNISEKVGSSGKTPWATIVARIYTDIRDNESSDFIQVNKRPAKFYLKKLIETNINISTKDNNMKEKLKNKLNFNERDLHRIISCNFRISRNDKYVF